MNLRNPELSRALEVLLKYENKISCNKCGACCGNCPALVGRLCSIHPKKIGERLASEQRSRYCKRTPVGLALSKDYMPIACPRVVVLLEQLGHSTVTGYDPETMIPIFISVTKNL